MTANLQHIIEIAREAGQIAREGFNQPRHTALKSSNVDLVTDTDRQVEAFIVEQLTQAYPDYQIVGEEGGVYQQANTNGYRWFIDPIDGTTNFAHGIPHFSVCVGLAGDDVFSPLLGVIYDPMRDECFAAERGKGATLNGQSIHVSHTTRLSEAVVASGFPYTKWTDPDNNATQWGDFVVRSRGVRRFGSAGLDMAYVAAGRFDGYWEHNLNAWDIMPSVICLLEAGGKLTNYNGEAPENASNALRLVASNGLIHDEMVHVLAEGANAPRPKEQ